MTTRSPIVPGLDGSPAPRRQDWWARTDPNAMLLAIADTARPLPAVWKAALAVHIMAHPDTILLGHSPGRVTIAHLLARRPWLRMRAPLPVAPADPTTAERTPRFGTLRRQRVDMRAIVVASRNDPWMPFDRARQDAQMWGAGLHDIVHDGHIAAASGYGRRAGARNCATACSRKPRADRSCAARSVRLPGLPCCPARGRPDPQTSRVEVPRSDNQAETPLRRAHACDDDRSLSPVVLVAIAGNLILWGAGLVGAR
ncbi:RBBP9/YdeN family alpha/beta hydrolase [Paracoccus spongiarum]|uniref:Alpha/beta hydrolase n=1 Tax=Paracoccus spongiarum TaxID=3064387 RepID=A0ABT9JGF6_9RHOB|nr:alpha/beta hydrolase [Paracoccus sp. 2205BS29-5]MDP5308700.1 alpha/beta hydrolase [Paracoccus sp. 2205BS29-5]